MKTKHVIYLWMVALLMLVVIGGYSLQLSAIEKQPSTESFGTSNSMEDLASPATVMEPIKCVVIDPGHQLVGNSDLEPLGPGATEMKAKVTGGTTGKLSGVPEYELNLQLSLQLKNVLEKRGYRVVMTRETNDVDISNVERAAIAERYEGDVFVRIHANGSDDQTKEGAMTICMTKDTPFHPELYRSSYFLSQAILDHLVECTGCVREYVWETDTMSGINWATIPVTIVEVGYMTNEKEDYLLETPEYQGKVVLGIADGIDEYFRTAEAP